MTHANYQIRQYSEPDTSSARSQVVDGSEQGARARSITDRNGCKGVLRLSFLFQAKPV